MTKREATHTPGPWSVWAGAPDMEPRVVANGGRHAVAQIKLASHGEHDANARLIAAAPDLLGTLVLALPYVECAEDDPTYKPGAVRKMIQTIRAAIAKAEGRS